MTQRKVFRTPQLDDRISLYQYFDSHLRRNADNWLRVRVTSVVNTSGRFSAHAHWRLQLRNDPHWLKVKRGFDGNRHRIIQIMVASPNEVTELGAGLTPAVAFEFRPNQLYCVFGKS